MRRLTLILFATACFSFSSYGQTATQYFLSGNEFFKQQKWVEAEKAYTDCIRVSPIDVSCHFNRGLTRQLGIGYGLALEDFNKVILFRPDAKAYNARGSVLASLKRYTEALADFDKAIQLQPIYPGAVYERAMTFEKMGNVAKAIENYTLAINQKPGYGNAHLARGRLYEKGGRQAEALADYSKAIASDANDAGALYARGSLNFKNGKVDIAEPDLKRAGELNSVYATLANSLRVQARSEAILAKSANVLKQNPPPTTPAPAAPSSSAKTAKQYADSGIALAAKGDHFKAIAEFTEAIRLAPNDAPPYFHRALSYERSNYPALAIADYGSVIRLGWALKEAYFNRGTIYLNAKDFAAAIADLDRSVAMDATRANVFYNRALAHYQLSDANKALGDLSKAIEIDPRHMNAYVMRSRIYCKQSLTMAAIKDQEKAISLGAAGITKGCQP